MNKKKEITRTLPDIKLKKIDKEKLKNILKKTITWYLEFLKNKQIEVPMVEKTIYGICDLDSTHIPISKFNFPCYDRIEGKEIIAPGEGRAINEFYDYMWEKGAFQITLTGPNPDKDSWKPLVFEKYIKNPVIRSLSDEAYDEAAKNETITLWNLPVSKISDLINKIADQIASQKIMYIARCSLLYVNHSGKFKGYKLSNNIYLKLYSAKELLIHISKHRDKFDYVDLQRYGFNEKVALIEFTGSISPKLFGISHEIGNKTVHATTLIENEICDTLDLCKWALMSGHKPISGFREDLIVYDDTIGNRLSTSFYGVFRRQTRTCGSMVYNFEEIDLNSVKLLMKKARKAIKQLPDLKQAFWYWGRSYVSQTDRDAVLDAFMGLESLLGSSAQGGGIIFKFCLYGTVLLAEDESEVGQIKKDLKMIYEERGAVTLGNKEKSAQKTFLGFTYLSKAIFRIIELHDQGILKKGSKISDQIESFLYENGYTCLHTKKVLSPTIIE